MSQLTIKFKKVNPKGIIPQRSTVGSAGYDMCACIEVPVTIFPGETVMIPTGIAMEIPLGLAGLIYPRSGMASKRGLAPANKVAVIDPDYRGEIFIALFNHGKIHQVIQPGDRIAQMLFTPYFAPDFEEVDDLSDTERGEGGFGSTGEKTLEKQPAQIQPQKPVVVPERQKPMVIAQEEQPQAPAQEEAPAESGELPLDIPEDPNDPRDEDERKADAAFEMGMRYKNGDGVEQCNEKAVEYFKMAAELGHVHAQLAVGGYYYAKNDCISAYKWLKMAADLGNAEALFTLGVFYIEGDGVDQDYEEAAKYFHRAARRRHAEAQFAYGDLLSQGLGVEKDEAKAVKWFGEAAENGQVEAMYRLGQCYDKGQGVEKNAELANKWYSAAVQKGHRMAAQALVMMQLNDDDFAEEAPAEEAPAAE